MEYAMLNWSHICRKRVERQKIGTKNRENEQKTVTNILGINSAISVATLNVSDLNIPIKRVSEWNKWQDSIMYCLKEPTLNMKTD